VKTARPADGVEMHGGCPGVVPGGQHVVRGASASVGVRFGWSASATKRNVCFGGRASKPAIRPPNARACFVNANTKKREQPRVHTRAFEKALNEGKGLHGPFLPTNIALPSTPSHPFVCRPPGSARPYQRLAIEYFGAAR